MLTNYPSGISSMGMPILPEAAQLIRKGPLPGGRTFWVGAAGLSTADNMRSNGTNVYTTLLACLVALGGRTHSGDCIYVLPGHTESVDAADWASAMGASSGFAIIGIGTGTMRPTFTWTTATSTLLLDTANVQLINCRLFLAGAHAAGSALTVAAPITVSGAGCGIIGCELWWGFDADQIVNQGIIWTGADGMFIGNRAFADTAAVPTATFMTLTAAQRIRIWENWIVGATSGTTVGVIRGLTTATLDMDVANNYMANRVASSTIAFSPLAASTGTARNNRFFVNSGILPITASILDWQENYCVDTAGLAGTLVGSLSA